jgi:hypothetical protein
LRGDRRVGGELIELQCPDDAEIMVAHEADLRPATDLLDDLVRPRPVPDEVAEAPDLVGRGCVDRIEDGLERV